MRVLVLATARGIGSLAIGAAIAAAVVVAVVTFFPEPGPRGANCPASLSPEQREACVGAWWDYRQDLADHQDRVLVVVGTLGLAFIATGAAVARLSRMLRVALVFGGVLVVLWDVGNRLRHFWMD